MDHGRTASCKKHVGDALEKFVGRRLTKYARISVVRDPNINRGIYFCYCGKPADFFILEVPNAPEEKEKSSAPKTITAKPRGIDARGSSSGDHSAGVRGDSERVKSPQGSTRNK
jgi:hypothetical protein